MKPDSPQAPHPASRRAAWLRQLTNWHWISSALCLIGMLFFSVTGMTLNHAAVFERTRPSLSERSAQLPSTVLDEVKLAVGSEPAALPASLQSWLTDNWAISASPKNIEWSQDEVFADLKRPGVDASLSIDLHSGNARYEVVDRGWMAYFNELHRGRNSGAVWHAFITVFGLASLIFCITGLLILQIHARARWAVWPITGAGLIIPLILMLLFIH